MISVSGVLFALLGGVLPALLWLWFWLREDRRNPEPRGSIMLCFVAGMLMVPLVIPFQILVENAFVGGIVIILWAALEEILKFGAAYITVLRSKEMNEPIDAVIYMITVALGFAALENALFLLGPISSGFVADSFFTGNLRFVGASLVHVLSSATVGIAMAWAYYKRRSVKRTLVFAGLLSATALHALFNFFIIDSNGEVDKILTAFLFVWIGVVIVILLFEGIKTIRNPRSLFIKRKK